MGRMIGATTYHPNTQPPIPENTVDQGGGKAKVIRVPHRIATRMPPKVIRVSFILFSFIELELQ